MRRRSKISVLGRNYYELQQTFDLFMPSSQEGTKIACTGSQANMRDWLTNVKRSTIPGGERRSNPAPGKRALILAMIIRAIKDLDPKEDNNMTLTKKKFLRSDAKRWLESRDDSHAYTFEGACWELGLSPNFLRRRIPISRRRASEVI